MKLCEKELRDRLKLYFVMGSTNCLKDPIHVLQEAIKGGITFFQFREKGTIAKIGQEKLNLAKQLQNLCKRNKIPFIVNDDVELALEIDADGVHIGQEDESPLEVRKKIGTKILGISAHNLVEAQQAILQGADYLGVGPMYETNTKKDIREVKGPSIIAELRENGITIPIVGIGGIKLGSSRDVMEAGADGIAVVSAISQHEYPQQAASQFIAEIKKNYL